MEGRESGLIEMLTRNLSRRVNGIYVEGLMEFTRSSFRVVSEIPGSRYKHLRLNTLRTGSFKLFKRPFPGF